jgi:Helix-turn-helix domain
MSNLRRDPDRTILVRTFGVTFRPRKQMRIAPPSARGWDQLICATSGMMSVHTEDCSWAVPPHRAIQVPAGLKCRVEMHGEVGLRILYLKTSVRPAKTCSVVNLTPLLRELVVRIVSLGALDSTVPLHRHLNAILRSEIRTLSAVPLQLPVPRDPRAVRFAETGDLRQCGASRRTMERIFRDETRMSLGQWMRRQKLQRALRLLAAGQSVKHVALELGYANPSAFIAMFRRELGETPAHYFAAHD